MAAATPAISAPPAPSPGPAPTTPPTSSPTPPVVPLSGSLRSTGTTRVANVRTLEWVARGFTKVVGDVEVGTGNVTGSLTVGGKVISRQLELAGTTLIVGDVRVSDLLRTRGTVRTGAGVSAKGAWFNGAVEIGGSLTVAETLQWTGSLEVGQDVRGDVVLFQGRCAIKGVLAAQSISGEIESLSSVNEIEADWVEIRHRKPRLPFAIPLFPPPPWNELRVERIEAKEVHLAGVRVLRLKADRIFLGPDAHVEYVEGTIVQRHKDAHVGPESESPPPPGLSR
jgi:cytoskeletal protein CcmA (bactofilin family)